IIAVALVLWQRARVPPAAGLTVDGRAALLARVALVAAAVVIVLGTATTAAGPHSGDEGVRRLGSLHLAVQLHGAAVFVLLLVALATRLVLQRTGAPAPIRGASTAQLW